MSAAARRSATSARCPSSAASSPRVSISARSASRSGPLPAITSRGAAAASRSAANPAARSAPPEGASDNPSAGRVGRLQVPESDFGVCIRTAFISAGSAQFGAHVRTVAVFGAGSGGAGTGPTARHGHRGCVRARRGRPRRLTPRQRGVLPASPGRSAAGSDAGDADISLCSVTTLGVPRRASAIPVNAPARTPCAWITSASAIADRRALTTATPRAGFTDPVIGTGLNSAPTSANPKRSAVSAGLHDDSIAACHEPGRQLAYVTPMPPTLVPSTNAIVSVMHRLRCSRLGCDVRTAAADRHRRARRGWRRRRRPRRARTAAPCPAPGRKWSGRSSLRRASPPHRPPRPLSRRWRRSGTVRRRFPDRCADASRRAAGPRPGHPAGVAEAERRDGVGRREPPDEDQSATSTVSQPITVAVAASRPWPLA